MRKPQRSKTFEQLETRCVFASDWQNPTNRLDVDASGFVVPLDVLRIINDINQNGIRTLPAKPANYSGDLCDTTGDGMLSPLDALQVVNAINQFPDPPTLNVDLSAASDGNGDEVVLTSNISYQGTSTPNVSVKVERLEGEQSTTALNVIASSNGAFTLPLVLSQPINHFRITVSDPRGRSLTTERVARLGNAVAAWNAAFLEVVRETTAPSSTVPGLLIKPPPPIVAKYLAMVHGAMFDAVNATSNTYETYLLNVTPQFGASAVAAAATAAHRVASQVYPATDQLLMWDRTLTEVMATVPEGTAKTAGIQLGIQAASVMLADRQTDGSGTTVTYTPGTAPGQWRPTAPDFAAATLPQWGNVKPFAVTNVSSLRSAAPPALTSAQYTADFDQVKRLGVQTGSERTADQTEIAKFWADGGGTSTPPGHWNQIAIDVGLENAMPLLESARMMALLNFALADAGIVAWDIKYAYNLWRPIDAIRLADTDGNAGTVTDATWTPLLNTPSFPGYVSGHSTFSGAAAKVLTEVLGTQSFETSADRGSGGVWPPSKDVSALAVRSFSSFNAAAEEAGLSRIYGGIHFSFDNTAGLTAGQSIAQTVVTTLLAPKTGTPSQPTPL